MTVPEIYALLLRVGFPPETAVKMAAVAIKESNGNPRAFNGRGPDESYGLWQINLKGRLRGRLAEWGLSAPEDLYDPETNARAAYRLWAGNDSNIARHWGTQIEPYATAYRNALVRVKAALGVSSSPSAFSFALPALPALPQVNQDTIVVGAAVLSVLGLVWWIFSE